MNQELLYLFVEQSPVAIAMFDLEMRYILTSKRWLVEYQLEEVDIIGKSQYELFPHLSEKWQQIYQSCLAGSTVSGEAIFYYSSGGDADELKYEINPWRQATGEIGGIIVCSRVIDSSKKLEQTWQKANSLLGNLSDETMTDLLAFLQDTKYQSYLLRSLIDATPDWIFIKDRQFRYILVNCSFADAIGKKVEDIVGKNDLELGFPPELVFGNPQLNIRGFRSDDVAVLSGQEIYNHYDPATFKDGSLHIFDTQKIPLYDPNGEIFGLMALCRDVTNSKHTESHLQEVLELQKAILDSSSYSIISTDTNGIIQTFNSTAQKWLGYTAEEVVGKVSPAIFHVPEEIVRRSQQLSAEVGQVIEPSFETFVFRARQGLEDKHEWTYIRKNGETFIVSLSITAIYDNQGEIQGFLGIASDITARKAAEKTQARLTAIIEATTDFVAITDELGKVTYINKAGRQMLGISNNENIFDLHIDSFHPTEVAERAFLEYIPIAIRSGIWQGESLMLHRDNRPIPVSQVIMSHKDTDGEVEFISTIARDISDRKQAEAILKESEQRFRDVSEAAGEYIWELDGNGIYTFVTDKSILVKGYAPADLLGHSPFDFMPEEDSESVKNILAAAIARKGSFNLQHRDILPNGEMVWEEVNGVPILNSAGEIIGFRGAGLSITERKLAELQIKQKATELEQTLWELRQTQSQLIQTEKMSSLGQLVAGVAHEINNPVNFIYGNLIHATNYTKDLINLIGLYQKHYPNPVAEIQEEADAIDLEFVLDDLSKLLASMKVGADRIQKIVLSLRNFSRMDEAEVKEVDIHEGLDSTLMILQNRLKGKPGGAEIEIAKKYGSLPKIECYAGQLNQVFMNILANAIDALEDSLTSNPHIPPRIEITTEVKMSNKTIVIKIADNGIGIPPNVQQRLFDPFFTTKPVGKGTGLGLSISYQIVTERHGGKLECFSEIGKGTEFVIEIPISMLVCPI